MVSALLWPVDQKKFRSNGRVNGFCWLQLGGKKHKSLNLRVRTTDIRENRWQNDPSGPESDFAILGGTAKLKNGCCQEYIAVPSSEIELCPAHLSDQEAAAIPLAALTAWRATIVKAGVQAGHNVLITGIGGGVALFCLQFSLAQGATVFVSSGSEDKIARAKALGATGGVNYKNPQWDQQLRAILPSERSFLDTVIDGAGGDIVTRSLSMLKAGGIISSYGMTLGPKVTFTMPAVMKNIEVCAQEDFLFVISWQLRLT